MSIPKQFISCDWGTSNFRVRLIDTETLEIISEHKTEVGVKKLFTDFSNQKEINRNQFFGSYLLEQIKKLNIEAKGKKTIIASGMISSSIGMHELPYAEMPFGFQGKELISKHIDLNEEFEIYIISGTKTVADVMRGEEIQAIGLSSVLPQNQSGLLVLPGTHSKHITFNNGVFENFTTFMTGELFDIISKESILSNSVTHASWNSLLKTPFLEGVAKGVANQQMASFFSIRANSLFETKSNEENFYFLSGLLIGGEISSLKNFDGVIYLSASGVLNELYRLALNSFLPKEKLVCFEESHIEKALLIGQKAILKTYE